eukprot:COSAG01_NODE_10468_length_2158_cov_8.817387_2_plen_260_part_00
MPTSALLRVHSPASMHIHRRDEPVKAKNTRGRIAFASRKAKNSRSTQMFISLQDNSNTGFGLDRQGFAPFAEVVRGMKIVDKIYSGYGQRNVKAPVENMIRAQGNAYLESQFPRLSYITHAERCPRQGCAPVPSVQPPPPPTPPPPPQNLHNGSKSTDRNETGAKVKDGDSASGLIPKKIGLYGVALLLVAALIFVAVMCMRASTRKKSAKTDTLLKELVAIDMERQNSGQLWNVNNPVADGSSGGMAVQGAGWSDEAL